MNPDTLIHPSSFSLHPLLLLRLAQQLAPPLAQPLPPHPEPVADPAQRRCRHRLLLRLALGLVRPPLAAAALAVPPPALGAARRARRVGRPRGVTRRRRDRLAPLRSEARGRSAHAGGTLRPRRRDPG